MYDILKLDKSFPASYECEVLPEWPTGTHQHYYFLSSASDGKSSTIGGRDGVIVSVHPSQQEAWTGTFEFGDARLKGVTTLNTHPNRDELCVVVSGAGYLVSVNKPDHYETIKAYPIIDVRPIPSHSLIVFADLTHIVAHGVSGLAWATDRLSWDSLKIVAVSDKSIHGIAYDLDGEQDKEFVIDIKTGQHTGGIRF